MEGKQVFSILIAVIMVGSIVGFTAFYSFPDQEPTNGNGQQQELPTTIDFSAEGVEARVEQILPSVKVQAETAQTDITAINSGIYSIEGMKRVNGRFAQQDFTILGTGFVYIASLSFEPDLNASYILEKLESKTQLQNIACYKFALIELPKTVSMHSVNQELDLTRDHVFSENISEALIGFGSEEGDVIKASLSATFVGEQATNLMAFEEENLTAKPIAKKAVLDSQIDSLESRLLFDAGLPYSLLDSVSLLEEEAGEIPGIVDLNLFLPSPAATIYISQDANIEEQAFSEFEAFLNDLNAESVSLGNNPLKGRVSFPGETDSGQFSEKLSLIEAKALSLGIEALLEEETGFLSGQAELDSQSSGQAGSQLKSLFLSKGLDPEIRQPGKLALAEIFDPDLGKSHSIPTGLVSAMLFTGHSAGEAVSVEVDYSLVRGKVGSAYATEQE